jgi:hypothetical protein
VDDINITKVARIGRKPVVVMRLVFAETYSSFCSGKDLNLFYTLINLSHVLIFEG